MHVVKGSKGTAKRGSFPCYVSHWSEIPLMIGAARSPWRKDIKYSSFETLFLPSTYLPRLEYANGAASGRAQQINLSLAVRQHWAAAANWR